VQLARRRVEPDDGILVRAVAFVAGLADLIGDRGELIRGIAILVVEGDLGAADDGEGVAALPAGGGERGSMSCAACTVGAPEPGSPPRAARVQA